ncbi:hypothetical protein F2Q69_00044325 [Brassica cretica]|uniref:Uncharacterized protein n=1 Tax=Brassica cretica TaxID=69181 RepID=A0A8S9NR56_BRACR|nr:hypothetical protein F2Q69_00044325 [Brassica cretica]
MGDQGHQDDLAAAMQLMQQQMQQMQHTIKAQKQQEQPAQTGDCSKRGNNVDTQKIDELAVKVDQLLKNNQGHVFRMEQAMAGQIQNQNQRQPHQHQDGKTVMNPRVEHCNATELRCEKAKGKEPEQLSAETAPGAEERTEHPASSEVTALDELAETPPVRVYVPKVPYPIPPRHLMEFISAEQLAGFRKMVRRLP